MAHSIHASVGQFGKNRPEDVLVVQQLLNAHRQDKLAEVGQCDLLTIKAIVEFQKSFLPKPDGRVDPGGLTWKHLTGTRVTKATAALVPLPVGAGCGYYTYSSSPDKQFGTTATIQALQEVANTFRFNQPDVEIGIGDISFAKGGAMIPHHGHQHGREADLRPLRKDQAQESVTIFQPQYDHDATELLVQSLLAHRNVKSILFNDTKIHGVTHYHGHDNHLHVKMKE